VTKKWGNSADFGSAVLFLLSAFLFLPFAAFWHDCDLNRIITRIFYLKVAEQSDSWHSVGEDPFMTADGT
jgi:hypothetical protein